MMLGVAIEFNYGKIVLAARNAEEKCRTTGWVQDFNSV